MTQAESFVRSYLGNAAVAPPSAAVAPVLRHWLLTDPLPNPLSVDDPRSVPGTWPDAFGVYHKLVTPEEMAPRWDAWLAFERDVRGLPDGPLAEPLIGHVYKASHFTVTQHWLIGAMHPSAARRKLSMEQALKLGELIRADGVIVKPDWMSGSRAIGWPMIGLLLEEAAKAPVGGSPPLEAVGVLLSRLQAAKGGDAEGHVWLWRNSNALTDNRHIYDQCPWMDATCLKGLAQLYRLVPSPTVRDLILHTLRVFAQAQTEDGRFVDDIGFKLDGTWGSKDDGKETMDPWIWPALLEAKDALDGDVPAWADGMLAKCKDRFLHMNRMKPSDSGFRDLLTEGVAIACAPTWGWRE